ncbi:MAG: flagellar hook-length control protein FliK [Steroidobacteraceae bacterium]
MTPTNLPVQPSTPATPASGSVAAPTEQAQTTDFLLMLGQLVAASVQRSGATATPTPKVPSMLLDEKKDEIDPEQLLAMFAMPLSPQLQPIDMPVENALQGMSGGMVAEGAEAPAKNILQEVARQVSEAKVFADIVDDAAQSGDASQTPDSLQGATPFQLQQPQAAEVANAHAHNAMSRPVHAPVGSAAWADEVGTRVVMMTESGNHTASLKLSPEHLGPLEINITVRDDKASVWFGAAHADTRAAIETALPRLREMFEAQGLSLADAGVFREPPREQPAVKNNMMSGEQGDMTDEVTTVSTRPRLGLVDAYA